MKLTICDNIEFEAEPDAWKITRYRDSTRPSELSLTFPRKVPVRDRVVVEMEDGGKIWFRGYVASQEIKNKQSRIIKCYGMEDLLFRRYMPRYAIPKAWAAHDNTDKILADYLTDGDPSLGYNGPVIGALYMLNSMIPEMSIAPEDDGNWTFKVAGYGTGFSSISNITFFGRAMAAQVSLANCKSTDDSYYRDAADLYVHPKAADFPDAVRGILCIKNAFDTGIRLGDVDSELSTLSDDVQNAQVNGESYGDFFQSVADWYALDVAYRYGKYYTYIDLLEDAGREPVNGLFTIEEGDIVDIRSKTPSEIVPQVMLGRGYGDGDARQKYTLSSPTAAYPGTWRHVAYEPGDYFATHLLKTLTDAEWARLAALENTYDLELVRSYSLNPYDYINLKLEGESAKLLQVEKLEYDHTGQFRLSLGNRDPDLLDEFNNRGSKTIYGIEGHFDYSEQIHGVSGTQNGQIPLRNNPHYTSVGGLVWYSYATTSPIGISNLSSKGYRTILSVGFPNEDELYSWVTVLKITIGGNWNGNCILRFYRTLDVVNGIDITNLVPTSGNYVLKVELCYTSNLPDLPVVGVCQLEYSISYVYTGE